MIARKRLDFWLLKSKRMTTLYTVVTININIVISL